MDLSLLQLHLMALSDELPEIRPYAFGSEYSFAIALRAAFAAPVRQLHQAQNFRLTT
jgi:hypothetical protein